MDVPANCDSIVGDKQVMQQYNEWCRRSGLRIFGKLEAHVCTNACMFWEYTVKRRVNKTIKPKTLTFVCKYSRVVHHCGDKCAHTMLSKHREGYVCALTGFQVANGPHITYVSLSKDTFSSSRLIGNNYVRMGKKTKVKVKSEGTNMKNGVSVNVLSMQHKKMPYVKIIKSTVSAIMTGKDRHVQYANNTERFLKEISSIARKKNSAGLEFVYINAAITSTLNTFQHLLRKPVRINDHRLLLVATAIIQYWEKFACYIHFSAKTIITFTAVCISKLRSGHMIGEITIFPMSSWVARHAPADIQFGGISGIQCRNMSILWRKMQEKIISPTTNVPMRAMLFELARPI